MIFVDTSFWVAIAAGRDDNHEAAKSLWADRNSPVVTSNHVLGETWTFLNRRYGHHVAKPFLQGLGSSPTLAVVHLTSDVEDDAWPWLYRHDEREYSFVDATSFAYMRRNRMTTAYAFDGDFAAAGFVEARP